MEIGRKELEGRDDDTCALGGRVARLRFGLVAFFLANRPEPNADERRIAE